MLSNLDNSKVHDDRSKIETSRTPHHENLGQLYSNKCLRKDAQPNDFFNEISHQIGLNELYTIEETLSIGSLYTYPIFLKVNNEVIKQELGCNYLLQVWGEQSKIYEMKFNYRLQMWGQAGAYLLFQPGQGDERFDELHIVNLEQPKQILRLQNLFERPTYADTNLIILANYDIIRFIHFDFSELKEEEIDVESSTLKQREINPKLDIKGVYGIDFAFERDDNQIDFSQLEVTDFLDDENFSYTWKQFTEIIPRDIIHDKIDKFCHQLISGFTYSVALRKSGRFDLYWEGVRQISSEEFGLKAIDVEMSTTTFYFKIKEVEGNECFYQLKHKGSRILTWDMAEKIEDPEFNFSFITYENVKHFVKLFKDMMIVSAEQTFMIVSHQNFLSCYDVIDHAWVKHCKFIDNIRSAFKIEYRGNGDTETGGLSDAYCDYIERYNTHIFVILDNNEIYRFDNDKIEKHDHHMLELEAESSRIFDLKGTFDGLSLDSQNKYFALIKSHEDSQYYATLIYYDVVVDITEQFGANKITENSNLVILQGVEGTECSFIHKNEFDILKYDVTTTKKKVEKKDEDKKSDLAGKKSGMNQSAEMSAEIKVESDKEGDEEEKPDKEEEKDEDDEGKVEIQPDEKEDLHKTLKSRLRLDLTKLVIKKYNESIKNSYRNQNLAHESFSYAIQVRQMVEKENKVQFLFFVQATNLFVYSLITKKWKLFRKQNIDSFLFFTNSVNYAICKGQETEQGDDFGLYYYNLEDIIKDLEAEPKTLLFKNIDLGCQTQLFYSKDEKRIGYFNQLRYVTVVPLLHTNMIKFIGINKVEEYFAYKVVNDKFIALHLTGKLQTWNLITGKYIGSHQLEGDWFLKYTLHEPEQGCSTNDQDRKNKVLLRSKESFDTQRLEDHFLPYQLSTNLENQKSFISSNENTIVHWKYIEIVNETSIEEHFNFYHPLYTFQSIYINNERQAPMLIERLIFTRVYLYKSEVVKGNQIRWVQYRRILNYDLELEGDKRFCPFYSPSFAYHIDINQKLKVFQIKDTFTNKLFKTIPKDLMSICQKRKAIDNINRMQFLDDKHIRLVNDEGIEVIVDFQNDFKLINQSTIQQFNHDACLTSHQYFSQKDLEFDDTEESLKRTYQEYKAAWNLFGKRDPVSLNEILYSVKRNMMQFSNLSFTFLHWSLIKQVGDGLVNMPEINEDQIQAMFYNILPGGSTCLHKFCENDQPDDVLEVFKTCQPDVTNLEQMEYFMPIIPNFDGDTPLHVAKKQLDYKSLDVMLKYLKGYGIDHHSKEIKDLLPHLIDKNLPELPGYLASRLRPTNQIKNILKTKLKDDFDEVAPLQLWYDTVTFQKDYTDETNLDKRIKGEYIDIPDVYHYKDETFQELFESLAGTDNYEFFKIKSVQKMIEFNYPLVIRFTIRRLFIPFILFLMTYVCYYNVFFDSFYRMRMQQDLFNSVPDYILTFDDILRVGDIYGLDDSQIIQISNDSMLNATIVDGKPLEDLLDKKFAFVYLFNLVCMSVLVAFASYFMINELRQFWQNKLDYLMSFWNYIDILPPIGLYFSFFLFFVHIPGNEVMEREVQAITTFFMWLKVLYFMRIFQSFGYLIRMISTVIIDMRHFLLVLFIGVVAFGDTFLAISLGNPEDGQFATGFINSIIYTYALILGGFDLADYENSIAFVMVMGLFILCTIFNMIVMLNLLIAIISESFANVNNNAGNAKFQEMASLIAENNYLIPDSVKQDYARQHLHLMVITNLEAVDSTLDDPVQFAIKELRDDVTNQYDALTILVGDLKKQNEEQIKENAEIKQGILDINNMLVKQFKEKKEGEVSEDEEEDEY